tara:strand:+ start:1084 stop:1206 length:123 start_codon:yes stop_codon:yes gene_type:complete
MILAYEWFSSPVVGRKISLIVSEILPACRHNEKYEEEKCA